MAITRRELLKATGIGLTAMILPPSIAWAATNPNRKLLVLLLHGGADGLDLVVPRFDDVNLQLLRNRGTSSERIYRAPDPTLDMVPGFWEMHPSFADAGLLDIFRAGRMSVVHACGHPDVNHSHFVAQDEWARAAPKNPSYTNGWLSQTALAIDEIDGGLLASPPALTTIALQSSLPTSMSSSDGGRSIAFPNIASFKVNGKSGNPQITSERVAALASMYTGGVDPVIRAGEDALLATSQVQALETGPITLSTRFGTKGNNGLNGKLFDAVRLLTNWNGENGTMPQAPGVAPDLGARIATVEYHGWDTHTSQNDRLGTTDGSGDAVNVAVGLKGVWDIVQPLWGDDLTVLVVTEFGRTMEMNANDGTDHGAGAAIFCLSNRLATQSVDYGSGLQNVGRVISADDGTGLYGLPDGQGFPTLAYEADARSIDLPPTTDFRAVYAEVLKSHMGVDIEAVSTVVIPGFTPPTPSLGLFT